jgi:hypothetical protein
MKKPAANAAGISISFIRPLFKLPGQNRQTGDPEKRFKPQ